MGLRTNLELTLQLGQDNALNDLVFDRGVQSVLDTLEHGDGYVATLDPGETNYVVTFGDVTQARLLYIEGDGEFNLTIGGGLATTAQVDAVGGSYPTGFVGGEILTIQIDGTTIATTFLATDQTVQQVVNRINAAAALLSLATVAFVNGSQLRFKSLTTGTSSVVKVVSGSVGVLAALGLSVVTVTGVNATPGTSPIQVRQPMSSSGTTLAEGVAAIFLGTIQAYSVTIDNPDPDHTLLLRIAIAGDLSPSTPCC